MFTLNGNPLPLDIPFTHEDIQYPANWLRLATPEERAAIGIVDLTLLPPDDLAATPSPDIMVADQGVA